MGHPHCQTHKRPGERFVLAQYLTYGSGNEKHQSTLSVRSVIRNENVYEILHHDIFHDWRMADLLDWGAAEPLDRVIVLRREPFLSCFGNRVESLPRHQELQHMDPGLFTTLRDVKDLRSVAFISHRWETPGQPDPRAHQLAAVITLLRAQPQLEYVWYDFWCLPQKRGANDDGRTAEEHTYFDWMLRLGLKWLILQSTFVPLWGENASVSVMSHVQATTPKARKAT